MSDTDTAVSSTTLVLPAATEPPAQKFFDPELFAKAAMDAGFKTLTQSAWIKISRDGDHNKGPRLYVANGKTCRQVAISAFEAPLSLASPAGKLGQGNVKQVMKMEGTEEEVLARFNELLKVFSSLPVAPPPAKKEPKKVEAKVEEASLPTPIQLVDGVAQVVES